MDETRAAGLRLGVCSASTRPSAVCVLDNLLGQERFQARLVSCQLRSLIALVRSAYAVCMPGNALGQEHFQAGQGLPDTICLCDLFLYKAFSTACALWKCAWRPAYYTRERLGIVTVARVELHAGMCYSLNLCCFLTSLIDSLWWIFGTGLLMKHASCQQTDCSVHDTHRTSSKQRPCSVRCWCGLGPGHLPGGDDVELRSQLFTFS